MYYKIFLPICFLVCAIFRPHINIFAELLLILLFWPLHKAFLGPRVLFLPL